MYLQVVFDPYSFVFQLSMQVLKGIVHNLLVGTPTKCSINRQLLYNRHCLYLPVQSMIHTDALLPQNEPFVH